MKKAQNILKPAILCALFAIIMALASVRASAQTPCCDMIVDIAPDVPCCVNIISTRWTDATRSGGLYCPPSGPIQTAVPCPAELITITVMSATGPQTIETGATGYVKIGPDCCVLITVIRNSPCNLIKITKALCTP